MKVCAPVYEKCSCIKQKRTKNKCHANAELDEEYSGSYYADCRSLIKWGLYTGTSDLSSTPCS